MRKFVGFGVIVLGFFLLMTGWESSESLSSQISRLFQGSPTDRTLWYLIGGVVALAVGASMVWSRRSPRTE